MSDPVPEPPGVNPFSTGRVVAGDMSANGGVFQPAPADAMAGLIPVTGKRPPLVVPGTMGPPGELISPADPVEVPAPPPHPAMVPHA